VPNNAIAAARKKRIEKAQEYGALWASEWSDTVTHVIVDQNLQLSDVKKAIRNDQLRVSLKSVFSY
jgi:DNA polymerase IV